MKIARLLIFGVLVWMVPFVVAFPFYSATGELTMDVFLFKSIMILTLVTTTTVLSVVQLKKTKGTALSTSLVVGLTWLLIPLLLDFLILIPVAEMSTSDYIKQIGMRYMVVPMIVIGQWVGKVPQGVEGTNNPK